MKRIVGLMALLIAVLTVAPAAADFYVIAGGGRLGTAITTLPYTITSPGLYYLTNNLTASLEDKRAITVNADDVTIDLMGFCLTGPGKGDGGDGIYVSSPRTNVEIRNGSIKGFGLSGIWATSNSSGIRVVGIRVRESGSYGIFLGGSGNLVMDCMVRNSGDTGIGVGTNSLVKGTQIEGAPRAMTVAGGSAAVGDQVAGCDTGIVGGRGVSVLDNTLSMPTGGIAVTVGDWAVVCRNAVEDTSGYAGSSAGAGGIGGTGGGRGSSAQC